MLKQQNRDGGKIHNGREGSIRLVIFGGDSAKPLDFLEKTLHQMAFFIQMPVNQVCASYMEHVVGIKPGVDDEAGKEAGR